MSVLNIDIQNTTNIAIEYEQIFQNALQDIRTAFYTRQSTRISFDVYYCMANDDIYENHPYKLNMTFHRGDIDDQTFTKIINALKKGLDHVIRTIENAGHATPDNFKLRRISIAVCTAR